MNTYTHTHKYDERTQRGAERSFYQKPSAKSLIGRGGTVSWLEVSVLMYCQHSNRYIRVDTQTYTGTWIFTDTHTIVNPTTKKESIQNDGAPRPQI